MHINFESYKQLKRILPSRKADAPRDASRAFRHYLTFKNPKQYYKHRHREILTHVLQFFWIVYYMVEEI